MWYFALMDFRNFSAFSFAVSPSAKCSVPRIDQVHRVVHHVAVQVGVARVELDRACSSTDPPPRRSSGPG
jgi:hypothetical protein